MNGAEAIIDFLLRKGVKHAFGYPGGPVIVLFDAIHKYNIPSILPRHEQGSEPAAEGYDKASEKPPAPTPSRKQTSRESRSQSPSTITWS